MEKNQEIIYMIQWQNNYKNPTKETYEHYLERHNIKTLAEVKKVFESYPDLNWFIGTESDYYKLDDGKDPVEYKDRRYTGVDAYKIHSYDWIKNGIQVIDWTKYILKSNYDEWIKPNTMYYKINGIAYSTVWKWFDHLKDGNTKGDKPTAAILTGNDKAIEITEAEYKVLKAKNDYDSALKYEVDQYQLISSPKLAAYIAKGEEYLSQHIGDIKSDSLKMFIGTNGKIDMNALEMVIKGHQTKEQSITLMVQLFAQWLVYIETGTEDSLKSLPENDPNKLNAKIDELWKVENDFERKELSAKLGISMATFAIVDKYLLVASGDEPEIKDK